MISPRRTRLVRVGDLHAFRAAAVALAGTAALETARATAIVVPTRGAARQLRRTLEHRLLDPVSHGAAPLPDIVTRDQLYEVLEGRLARPVRRLSAFERDAIVRAAANEAARTCPPPFRIRPGLLAEVVRFYDQLRRQRQSVDRFEELLTETLARDIDLDHGAARTLEQTRFLSTTFRGYERRLHALAACDEHGLREHLLVAGAVRPLRRAVITVADWIADPHGLCEADFDLLTRLPGLEEIHVIATERMLASGFHQRIHRWLPEIDETDLAGCLPARRVDLQAGRPVLLVPQASDRPLMFEFRDREEELIGVARRLKAERPHALDRVAVVFKRPLPYLYLARTVFGSSRIPYETQDAMPLAAEPAAAAVDLLLQAAASQFNRESLVAVLRSPFFDFGDSRRGTERQARRGVGPESVAALDRALSEAGYLGELELLRSLATTWTADESPSRGRAAAQPALDAALAAATALEPLTTSRPLSNQLATIVHVFRRFGRHQPDSERAVRGEAAVLGLLESLAAASAEHDDPAVTVDLVAADFRRWLEDETFVPESNGFGVQVLDAEAARYGDFDEMSIVGLIEGEWPERPRRNVFYPPALLAALGWPSEQERQGAAAAVFVDLLGSASTRTAVSTFTLDDESLVEPSVLADEIESAGLAVSAAAGAPQVRVFEDEALSLDPLALDALDEGPRKWAALRAERTTVAAEAFHGHVGVQPSRSLSVSSIERYLKCPFQFFARHVLRLAEEPEDDEVMDPKKQGMFVHAVFEAFFREWQARGHGRIRPVDLAAAQELFASIAETHLASLPGAEASLERTRLLGSPVAPGLGDTVFRMESERPVEVVERLLEYPLDGTFTFAGPDGPRSVALRGIADRIDLLCDGTLRIIDYKLSSPPNRAKALQLPVYGLCAEQRLDGHAGRHWSVGQAAYIAFRSASRAKRITPLFTARANRDEVLASAQARLIDAVDAIERGEFPPRPDDVFLCDFCSYTAVCRKDYVGEV